jgi:hypothetical protein
MLTGNVLLLIEEYSLEEFATPALSLVFGHPVDARAARDGVKSRAMALLRRKYQSL